jgi:YD repeat-containing protein
MDGNAEVSDTKLENRGRLVTHTDGAGGAFRQEKNAYGELTGETNRLGDRQSYSYDQEGRVTGQSAYSGKPVAKEYRDSQGRETR